MNTKTLLFTLAATLFLVSCGGGDTSSSEEYVPEDWTEGDHYVDTMPSKTEEGTIFHAFCWSFNQIKENLDAIADAGFKTIQTSPVTDVKGGGASWWAYYQPVSYAISTRSGLGNKAQLEALCSAAHMKGMNIIVDIVFNHLATTGEEDADGLPIVDPEVEEFEPYIYQHQDETFHHVKASQGTEINYYPGLPDLNTANEYVQERSLSLLKECIDVGVDGFRFDAAKHIETPDDTKNPSSFWDNTLEVAKAYYTELHPGKELFAYGEILGGVDSGRTLASYTKYMRVTDDSYFSNAMSGLFTKTTADKTVSTTYKTRDANTSVTWIESHDTWVSGKAKGMANDGVIRSWAYLSGKKGSIPLYLARTDEKFTVANIGDYAFEDTRLSAINKFRNRFANTESLENVQNDTFYINERYSTDDAGAVLIDCSQVGSQRLKFTNLADGYYFDQISGRQYHIVDGSCFFLFDDKSATIVLTKTANKKDASISISSRGEGYVDSIDVKVTLKNATGGTYSVDDAEPTAFTNSVTIKIGNMDEEPNTVHNLVITYTNGTINHVRHYSFNKIQLIEGGFNVINMNPDYLTDYNLYIWSWAKGKEGVYSQAYTWNDEYKILLISDLGGHTNFLLALFDKDVTPKQMDKWDTRSKKQTKDLLLTDRYFDAKDF